MSGATSDEPWSVAIPGAGTAASASPKPTRGWIQSPGYDLGLLLLAPLVGIPFLLAAPTGNSRLGLVLCGLLGFPHYLSTFTFYFWDENRAYHRERWGAYFAGPAIILGIFAALVFADQPPFLLPTALLLWNTVHVARQSCGVLSIYRHRAGVTDAGARTAANPAIILVSLWMSLANVESHRQVFPWLVAVHPQFPPGLRVALGAAAIVALLRLGVALWRRGQRGAPLGAPEALALACGLLLFHPYLWIADSTTATLGMLLGHFVQYLALVWLLHRRRFREAAGSRAQRLLFRLGSDTRVLLAAVVSAAFGLIASYLLCVRLGFDNYFQAAFQVLVFNHFYLDGLFWAFREPRVRARLGPYLG